MLPQNAAAMKRLVQAPNLALATLWADMLDGVGVAASVQRAHVCALVGQIPPDQCLPEVWVHEPEQFAQAQALLHEWQHLPHRHWACRGCGELVDGPFEQCWNCGAARPAAA